jgi:DNA-binding transcriptional LysR family regulator
LSLSQPPLSLAIRQLEDSLGTKLFHRNSRNVELTAAGRALQREANHLLRRLEEARDIVMAVDQGHGGVFRIGFGGSTMYRALPNLIRQFKAAQPSIEVRLQELNSVEQVLALKREDIDFGFINGRELPSGLNGFRYWSEPFYACLPEGHACSKGRTVKLEDLANEEFVMFG